MYSRSVDKSVIRSTWVDVSGNDIHGLTQWPQSYTVAFNTLLFLEFFNTVTHITWYTV